MKLLFTVNSLPVSKIITSLTNQPVSHCGFLLESIDTILHSDFLGVHPVYLKKFTDKNKIVYTLDVPLSLERELYLYKHYLENNYSRWYDFGGILYFGVRLALKRLFNIPIPKQNLWADKNMDFCVEALCRVCPELTGVNDSGEMMTPYEFYLRAKEALEASDKDSLLK